MAVDTLPINVAREEALPFQAANSVTAQPSAKDADMAAFAHKRTHLTSLKAGTGTDLQAPPPSCSICEAVRSCRPSPLIGSGVSAVDKKQGSSVRQLLSLLSSFAPGSDISRLQVPPAFNLPKSQLQLFGEAVYGCRQDLLGACAQGEKPIDRFLAAVRWHISTTRLPPFGKAPYNPILGETHHVASGDLRVILEQVTHQPPSSALYATLDSQQLRMSWWHCPVPRFYGTGVEVDIHGSRELFLDAHHEQYTFTSPNLCFQFLPTPASGWIGTTTISCKETNFDAKVTFKGLSSAVWSPGGQSCAVSGCVKEAQSGKVLYTLRGNWNRIVYVKDVATGKEDVLYNSMLALDGLDGTTVTVVNTQDVSETESILVWRNLTTALMTQNWDAARRAKSEVENAQREARKRREAQGVKWIPAFFVLKDGRWEWRDAAKAIPKPPLALQLDAPKQA